MLDFIKNAFKSKTQTNMQFDNKTFKTKQFINESELPEWIDDVVAYNCGWSEDRRGFLVVVAKEATPPKSN